MRGILLLLLLATTLGHAAWNDYVEARDLVLDADGVNALVIDAGAGKLEVNGSNDASVITVTAKITVPDRDDDKAGRIIESDLVLTLERDGEQAVLKSYFERGATGWRSSPVIDLEIVVPERLGLAIDDGSGLIDIADVRGDITVDDGSGSITMVRVGGDIRIEDGSGSISVSDAAASVSIVDGSGSISVRKTGGTVTIDDGSGSIDVSDVARDLIIVDDGSGSISFARIEGRVEQND